MTREHDSRKPESSCESGFDFFWTDFDFPRPDFGFGVKFGARSVFSFSPHREFYGSRRHQPVDHKKLHGFLRRATIP